MKKSTIVIIATGLISLALCVIFSVITVIVFTKTAASKVDLDKLKAIPENIEQQITDITGEDGIYFDVFTEDDEEIIGFTNGIDINSDGNQVHVGLDGIEVHNGEDVSISWDGIEVEE